MLPDAPWTLPSPTVDLQATRLRGLRLTLKLLLDWPCALMPTLRHPYAEFRVFLAELYRKQPAAVLSALTLPTVSAPILAAAVTPEEGLGLLTAVPALLIELGRRRVIGPGGHWWGAPISVLASPMLGWVRRYEPPVVGALFLNGEVDLGEAGGLVLQTGETSGFWPLKHGGWLAGWDSNPLAMVEAHPDKEGNALDFGTATPTEWVTALDAARDMMQQALPELAEEHRRLLTLLVPVGTHGSRSFSASYREAIGQVYLSLVPEPLALAEALIHETQHNKLNLLSLLDPILEDRGQTLYRSPVRPDPRPLWGILLAVHAFLPVALLYRQLQESNHPLTQNDRFTQHFQEILRGNQEGMEVLRQHARPTPEGKRLLEGMDALERMQQSWH